MNSETNTDKSTNSVSMADATDIIIRLSNGVAVRSMRSSDVANFARHGNNIKIWNFLRNRMPHPYTEADAQWWHDRAIHQPESIVRSGLWTAETGSQGPEIRPDFAITIDDEAVGSIGLEFGSDIYFRTAEIGYWLSEEHWGKGIMSQVVPAFVEWAWKTFDILVRLNAEAYENNAGSRKLLEKAGFQIEGRKKNAFVKNGKFGNSILYGLLRPGTE